MLEGTTHQLHDLHWLIMTSIEIPIQHIGWMQHNDDDHVFWLMVLNNNQHTF